MRVPLTLSNAFQGEFQTQISDFLIAQGLLPDSAAITSERFLARSVVPHVTKLSSIFNREEQEQGSGLERYWKESSNPAHLRLAYFLYFMPSNLFRVASVWAELSRLGYRWPAKLPFRAIEFGAGPAAGASGIAAGEAHAPVGLPAEGNWALIEQDRPMLQLGAKWAGSYFESQGRNWGVRDFHRTVEIGRGFLPRTAPSFSLWVMSYFLNECLDPPSDIARALVDGWDRHLEEGGLVILVEPALRAQSRKLLELRKELLAVFEKRKSDQYRILLPCLGHQACGALSSEQDWCHEDVSWWRPPYFRVIDKMSELDRKSLPFSYLVVSKTKKTTEELFPELRGSLAGQRYRLVSPAHPEGREQEFFVCGQEGKRRARYRAKGEEDPAASLERGDILVGADLRGDARATRVERLKGIR
ncbi:MAG: hypothetical protein A2X94_16910 [Bdellovibrionales bacterium GWB1_55_8]|nr:MAG: hypothetical protein A2X94_16910 [Bdellovibrionales bacterium GWB1_55_8]